MRIVVAGATGVVGRLLLPKLIAKGHEVIGMTRKEQGVPGITSTGARAAVVDALDSDAVSRLFEAVQPDVVIHQLTALSHRDFAATSRLRTEGTRNLVEAAQAVGVRRMIVQSIAWAYESGAGLATEEDGLDLQSSGPRQRLVESIHSLEKMVRELPEHVILRYGMFYGEGTFYDNQGFMAQQVRSHSLPATNGITSFLHVEDAAEATVQALHWPTGAVNIVDDDPAPGTQWLPVFAKALGAPMPDVVPECESWERGASNAKARREYGWDPIYPTWRSGLPESLRTSFS